MDRTGLRGITSQFVDRTTIHGVPQLAAAKSIKSRLFWSAVCLTSTGMFIFLLSQLIVKYLKYPVVVKVYEVRYISFICFDLASLRDDIKSYGKFSIFS